jgi:hypothetical protein
MKSRLLVYELYIYVMFLVEAAVQRLDVSNIFLECFAGDVEKWVAICLNGLN